MADATSNTKLREFVALLRTYPGEAADGGTLADVLEELDRRLNAVASAMATHSQSLQAQSAQWTEAVPAIGEPRAQG